MASAAGAGAGATTAAAAAGGEEATSGKWWVTSRDAIAPRRSTKLGPGEKEAPSQTVFQAFTETVNKHGTKTALCWLPDGANPDPAAGVPWQTMNWREYYHECIKFAKALLAVGFKQFEAVTIMGFNHKNWNIADLGCIAAGGLAAGIYTTSKPAAAKYIVGDCAARVAVIESKALLDNVWAGISEECESLKYIVVYGEKISAEDAAAWKSSHPTTELLNWDDFLALGSGTTNEQVQERLKAQQTGNCCTLIYTSGTTGPPKGVMLSHDNLTWTADTVLNNIFNVSTNDRMLSYLPLSHIAAQMLDIHAPIQAGAVVYFATVQALKGALPFFLQKVEPTIFFGVPRVWGKVMEAIKAKAAAAPAKGLKKKLINGAKAKATEYNNNIQKNGSGAVPCCFGFYNKLVLSKIKAALGLTHVRVCATGAAPISMDTLEFFASLGLPIYEVFGQSECTGPQTVNYPSATGGAGEYKMGSAGPGVPGSEMRIVVDGSTAAVHGESPRGELIYRGRHIMMGYLNNAKKTAETIDEDGWLHSGDEATIDEDGFMRITGRLKELLITEGGENIPPVLIEQEMKKQNPAISNVVVIGDKRKYLTMLVTLHTAPDSNLEPTNDALAGAALQIANAKGLAKTLSGALADPGWHQVIWAGIKAANANAASNAQKVQKYRLLSNMPAVDPAVSQKYADFSVGSGYLTDTQKLKRSMVNKHLADVIESMYAKAGEPNPPDTNIGAAAGAGAGVGAH